MSGAFAAADNPPGAVLVVHENRGLTAHIRSVAGRLAGAGYAALATDLLSRVGGHRGDRDARAALAGLSAPRSGRGPACRSRRARQRRPGRRRRHRVLLRRRHGVEAAERRASELAAAVPFYGPGPGTRLHRPAAVLGVYAERTRVNAGRAAGGRPESRGLTHDSTGTRRRPRVLQRHRPALQRHRGGRRSDLPAGAGLVPPAPALG